VSESGHDHPVDPTGSPPHGPGCRPPLTPSG